MRPPKKVRISPYVYDVQDIRGLPDAGSCHPDFETITVWREQADNQKRDTTLHECLHAIIAQGWSHTLKALSPNGDGAMEEELVGFLAPRVLGLLRDNPALVEYLTDQP